MIQIPEEKRSLFHSYASEFEKKFLLEPPGQKHLEMYRKERGEVKKYWEEVKDAKQKGQDITDPVLHKLLPYGNTRSNRENGYRISIAPAIIKDVKKWFENSGHQKPDNWPNVAQAIYTLIYDLVEKDDWGALAKFEQNQKVSKGMKAGFLTPTLYFLNPKYRLLNSKTVDTVNFLLGKKVIGRELTPYKEHLDIIQQALNELGEPLFTNADVFDAFCHWMCDKRLGGYARYDKSADVEIEEEVISAAEEEEEEPKGHWEAIFYIVEMGNLLGFKTYVADPSRMAFGKKLKEVATLSEVPPILQSAPHIEKIDALWYKPTPPFFLFEVEDGGTMRDALHRLYNAMAFDAKFFVVCPAHNLNKFTKWVTTAPFKEFEERYNFRTYTELFEFYKQVKDFTVMRKRFLLL